MGKFFIYDCDNNVVGNPKGYTTIKGATIQAESRKSKIYHKIWDNFYKRQEKHPEEKQMQIYAIRREVH